MVLILDGKAHAEKMLLHVESIVKQRTENGLRAPCLAVVIIGDDPASQVYVRGKINACKKTGIHSVERYLPASTSQIELESIIDQLNCDTKIDGILLQLPLPQGLNFKKAISRINFKKDVDGLHPWNQGLLMTGQDGLRPCTPLACISMLKEYNIAMKGKKAVVVGRSEIVGKPISLMLLAEHATVSIAHSMTVNLPDLCRESDIIIAAVGIPGLIEGDWIKPGAVVVDVGINRVDNLELGKIIFHNDKKKLNNLKEHGSVLCGDVRFGEAINNASAITPVPGGVGPLTIAGLMTNTIQACQMLTEKL